MQATLPPVGDLIRHWRNQRRLSQLELSVEADISARHLCFVETGRSQPTREMVLKIAEHLDVPLRERNVLLNSAGYAPYYREDDLAGQELSAAREAVDLILQAHEPYPALAFDRHWNLVAANKATGLLLRGLDPEVLASPVNLIRLSISPRGLAPRIMNLEEWFDHSLHRIRREAVLSGDLFLHDLAKEIEASMPTRKPVQPSPPQIAITLRMMIDGVELAFLSTRTVFGTATEVTLSELTLETFFPADAKTRQFLTQTPKQ